MSDVKYPDVVVHLGNLGGPEGNAFAILGNVTAAMRRAGKSKEEIEAFKEEATASNYGALLRTVFKTVSVTDRNVLSDDEDEYEPCPCGCEDDDR